MRRRGAERRNGDNVQKEQDGRTNRSGIDGVHHKMDCATCVVYALLVVFFALGVLIAAAGRPVPPTRGTPNTPWDIHGGSSHDTGLGGAGSSQDNRRSSYQYHDDDENAQTDEEPEDFRPDIGLWEGLGIIAIDRLSKVQDYLEGILDTLDRWKEKLESFNEDLSERLAAMDGNEAGARFEGLDGETGGRRAVQGGAGTKV